jgi:hypothetical protein
MRKASFRFGHCLVAIVLAALTTAAHADEWSFVSWYMTEAQATAAAKTAGLVPQKVTDPYEKSMNSIEFYSKHFGLVDSYDSELKFSRNLGGVTTTDYLLFLDGRLHMIEVSMADKDCSVLLQPMKRLHGAPIVNPPDNGAAQPHVFDWRFSGKFARLDVNWSAPCQMFLWPG